MKFFQATEPSNWREHELFKFAFVHSIFQERFDRVETHSKFFGHSNYLHWTLCNKDFRYGGVCEFLSL